MTYIVIDVLRPPSAKPEPVARPSATAEKLIICAGNQTKSLVYPQLFLMPTNPFVSVLSGSLHCVRGVTNKKYKAATEKTQTPGVIMTGFLSVFSLGLRAAGG